MRTFRSFSVRDKAYFKAQMLNWLGRFNICCFLDNHQYSLPPHLHDCMAAAGQISVMHGSYNSMLDGIEKFNALHHDWIFGHFGYDLKNEIEELRSDHPDPIGFPDSFLFVPEYVVIVEESSVSIGSLQQDHDAVFNEISAAEPVRFSGNQVEVKQRISRDEYISSVQKLQEHIHRGDCYEINFCQEFYAEHATIDPAATYHALSGISPNPFSVFYRWGSRYLLCASPERFLTRQGNRLLSQPIKGTIARDIEDPVRDLELKNELSQSLKDKTENVMIVDLVRNDLSRVCNEGTVEVNEMFGIYAFPQVYQMVSTVSGELKENMGLVDILRACFPMGSMTGAPKRKVLELIERYERTKRGIFSGSVGYITPGKDFDFNVVIRSIMYNEADHYLQFMAGSGITASSDPVQEYEECMLKASAIRKILS
ncbi:MAG TPA: anthranilate synthase component I family protein [Chitinophagaceae bacterium]|nr:anthranilate synthase component I family protein [Chitinophagaceae bacterium]